MFWIQLTLTSMWPYLYFPADSALASKDFTRTYSKLYTVREYSIRCGNALKKAVDVKNVIASNRRIFVYTQTTTADARIKRLLFQPACCEISWPLSIFNAQHALWCSYEAIFLILCHTFTDYAFELDIDAGNEWNYKIILLLIERSYVDDMFLYSIFEKGVELDREKEILSKNHVASYSSKLFKLKLWNKNCN